jgi:23S rRNA (adenine2503-C2)-methyltransferase
MKFQLKLEREDQFTSRFFDYQVSRKYLVQLDDGANIETTLYEHSLAGVATDVAIDISTMVGCPMGCSFCASATQNFGRALAISEIVGQVRHFLDTDQLHADQITCSYQGIGEPSVIPDLVVKSSECLLRLDPRIVISVSTMASNPSGVIKIASAGFPIHNFQLSLGGVRPGTLDRLMRHSPGLDRIAEISRVLAAMPNVAKTKVNVVLIQGVNDSDETVDVLANVFAGTDVIVKISSLNPTKASMTSGFRFGEKARAEVLVAQLLARRVDSFVYGAFRNIGVSCGQLAILS